MKLRKMPFRASVAAMALLSLTALSAFSLPTHNVPNGVAIATDRGRVDPGKEMNLSIVLKMHNRTEFDRVVEDLYDPTSTTYHQWLTKKDLEKYAPTAAEFETVRNELLQQGFSVVSSDPQRFWIRVHGTAATVERAFQTELHEFNYNGRIFQAHIRDAELTGEAGDLVDSVCGLERHQSRPQLSYVRNPLTGQPILKKPLTTRSDRSAFVSSLTDKPLTKSASLSFTTPGESLPTAAYTGLQYGVSGQMGGFTPSELQSHYGLTSLIGDGYNGAGETIALVEAYGYPEALTDANAAASLFGLPELTTGTNFSLVYPEGKPVNPNAGVLSGWDGEIALDIQSAHAIAPGATILVVVSAGQDNEDQIASLNYIVTNNSANTVSSSWENDEEILSGPLEEVAFNTVLETGAAQGIAFQFASGDGGDNGLGTPVGAVGVPSNSPYATAVGGTTVIDNPYSGALIVTGWGNNAVDLYYYGVEDPLEGYFSGGAGGGESQYYKKPIWQSALSGAGREVPDVSALADPYTGFAVVLTESGTQYGLVIGGTSLACPIFTATWSIANQWNGAPLGQAAPIVSTLTSGEITDVLPPAASFDKYDVAGSITDSGGTTDYTSTEIFTEAENVDGTGDLSLYTQKAFLSAVWPYVPSTASNDGGIYVVLSFGTDSSLTVKSGWDNVTGWGEPNGLPFIEGVTGKTTGAPLDKK
jgi:subtilase family serine protease